MTCTCRGDSAFFVSLSKTGGFDGVAYGIPHQTRLLFTEAASPSVLSLFATFYSQVSLMQGPHPAWAPTKHVGDKHQETPPKRLDESLHAPPCLQLPLTVGLDGAEAEVIRKPVLLAWPGFFSLHDSQSPPVSGP